MLASWVKGGLFMTSTAVAIWIAIVIVAVIVVVSIFTVRASRRREAMVQTWAAARNYTYLKSNSSMVGYVRGLPFTGNENERVQEFISGATPGGRSFASFKYTYDETSSQASDDGDTQQTTTIDYAVVSMRLPARLPSLSVTRRSFLDKLAKLFGGQDIVFESTEFNKMYRVKSDNEPFAYGVFQPQTLDWFMGPAQCIVPFVMRNTDMFCWHKGRPDYTTLESQLQWMEGFIDQIPQFAIDQFGEALPL